MGFKGFVSLCLGFEVFWGEGLFGWGFFFGFVGFGIVYLVGLFGEWKLE